jgi:hypothetical protein
MYIFSWHWLPILARSPGGFCEPFVGMALQVGLLLRCQLLFHCGLYLFYVLHQPVILLLGFFIITLPLPILGKYLLIAALAFGVTLGIYEYGIRRFNPARRVFGLKALKPLALDESRTDFKEKRFNRMHRMDKMEM